MENKLKLIKWLFWEKIPKFKLEKWRVFLLSKVTHPRINFLPTLWFLEKIVETDDEESEEEKEEVVQPKKTKKSTDNKDRRSRSKSPKKSKKRDEDSHSRSRSNEKEEVGSRKGAAAFDAYKAKPTIKLPKKVQVISSLSNKFVFTKI